MLMRRSILLAPLLLLAACTTGQTLAPSEKDHSVGPIAAKVVFMEYADYQCPACASVAPMMKQAMARYSDRVRFVFRPFPLSSIHPNAIIAVEAAEAAGAQGKFWEMHDKLFETQNAWQGLKDPTETFVGYARELGLDADRMRKDLTDHTYRAGVKAAEQAAMAAGVRFTPAFYLNGKPLADSPNGYVALQAILDKALMEAESTSVAPASSTAPAASVAPVPSSAPATTAPSSAS